MPLKLGNNKKTFDFNIREFYNTHKFPKNMTIEQKIKQSLAVAYDKKRKVKEIVDNLKK